MSILQPVVAGKFYPAERDALVQTVAGLLANAPKIETPQPKALILPHAGFRFSGATAAAGAVTLRDTIKRVVLLGPSHYHGFKGVALPDAKALSTPLRPVPIDPGAVAHLLSQPDVSVIPEAFAQEHSIEVELPFLQAKLSDFAIVPLVVGDISTERLTELLGELWSGPETLIVISTDLTHFLTAGEASKIDLDTAMAIERCQPKTLGPREACGHRPLAAFLRLAAQRGMRLTRLGLTHSGKVTGENDRVVGYGAWMAHEQLDAKLGRPDRELLLRVARQALMSQAVNVKPPRLEMNSFPARLHSIAATFVTLTLDGRLRGCIGSMIGHQPLVVDVANNAIKAGFHDPRFDPITSDEITAATLEIAVLSRPARLRFRDEADLLGQLRPGQDGLILRDGDKRGTFLPKVWEQLETPEAFLSGLKVKAGLPRDHWSSTVEVQRYGTETFRSIPQT